MPKLSIIVPIYNSEQYLHQCLDSILVQSFGDFELILVNDGSTDRSGIICDHYARRDSRVVVIHSENRGVVTARRTGVDRAQGEYTAFVDSDDWLDGDFYRGIFENTGGTSADILICSRVHRAAGCVQTTAFPPGFYNREKLESSIFPQMIYDMASQRYRITPTLWDKLFRTELLREVYAGVDPGITLGEDAVCTYPCIARSNSLLILDNSACYHYREDHVSMVNHCDIRLLERVSALAVSMDRQFFGLSDIFDGQIKCFLAYNGLYAAHQVLLCNRKLRLVDRIGAVRKFWDHPLMAHSFRQAQESACPPKMKWKLHTAAANRPCLFYPLIQFRHILQKLRLAR